MRRLLPLAAAAALLALPFLLRPRGGQPGRTDDVVVVVTPHNEAIRHEFALGFADWYRRRTGRNVAVDWRVLGGTAEISRFLEGQYAASFRDRWEGRLGRRWSDEVQGAFQAAALPAGASPAARAARAAFLASDAGCGIDVLFGGDAYDYSAHAEAGRLVASGLPARHPDWFGDRVLPERWDGQPFRDPQGRWLGSVISCYGILYNRDRVARLGLPEPAQWADLADFRYFGTLAACDPTKSGSTTEAFENLIQQRMGEAREDALAGNGEAADPEREAQAVREGWLAGLRLAQAIGANARYFTDVSQKPPIDVAAGDCAAGLCIDFFGRGQAESTRERSGRDGLAFVVPPGGTAYSVDPIGLLRGAPHRAAAEAFLEYVLSLEGQKLWNFRPGAPGGPREFALRRLPVRRDFYGHAEWEGLRSDPAEQPYAGGRQLVYRLEWTGGVFREIAFLIRVMCLDTHGELGRAWAAANRAPEPARSRALEALQDLSAVDYDRVCGEIKRRLESPDPLDAVRLARELDERFRRQYARAEELASGR